MIIALARLQFCRLLSAGKCPRGNGQIDSRVSSRARSSKARVATKRSWIGARVRTEGAGVRHCTVQ